MLRRYCVGSSKSRVQPARARWIGKRRRWAIVITDDQQLADEQYALQLGCGERNFLSSARTENLWKNGF